MYYFLSDAASRINLTIQRQLKLLNTPQMMSPYKNFLWADDLATLLQMHPKRAKEILKIYFTIMIEEGEKWGLTINYTKSAIMEMFSKRTNYRFISDQPTQWKKGEGCSIQLTIFPNGKSTTINIPIVAHYKYLGVRISRNLSPEPHLKAIKAKINYIIYAFTAVRSASKDLRFCHNTWQLFIRPLLDYSQTYFSFLTNKARNKLQVLYRESLRKMLFLYKTTPIDVIDRLVQYDYYHLHESYRKVYEGKTLARLECDIQDPRLRNKVNFNYNKVSLESIPMIWIKVWNLMSLKGKTCKIPHHGHSNNFINNMKHILDTLTEYNIHNVLSFLYNFLDMKSNEQNIEKLHKIYNLLLSMN